MDVGSLIGFLVLYSEVGYFYLTLAMPDLVKFSISAHTGTPHNDSLGVDHLLIMPYLEDDNDSSADISAVGFSRSSIYTLGFPILFRGLDYILFLILGKGTSALLSLIGFSYTLLTIPI